MGNIWINDEKFVKNQYKNSNSFSLENGGEKLEPFFLNVEIERYKDSLEVTNIDDLMDYIYSGITFEKSCTLPRERVREILLEHMVDGVLKLPKDPGTFVAWGER